MTEAIITERSNILKTRFKIYKNLELYIDLYLINNNRPRIT